MKVNRRAARAAMSACERYQAVGSWLRRSKHISKHITISVRTTVPAGGGGARHGRGRGGRSASASASKTVNARVLSAKSMQVYEMPDVPKEVSVAVREMVSEVAAKAVAEEENISVRKSSSSASGYVGVRKIPSGRFMAEAGGKQTHNHLGTYDSAYEAVARGMDADEVGKPSAHRPQRR